MGKFIDRVKSAALTLAGVYEDVRTPYGTYTLTDRDLAAFLRHNGWGYVSDASLINSFYSFSEVFTPVDHIARRVSNLKFVPVDLVSGQLKEDKSLTALLTRPNALQTFQAFIYEAIAFELVTGKNFTYAYVTDTLKKNYKTISKLENLSPDLVSLKMNGRISKKTAVKLGDYIAGFMYSSYGELPVDNVSYSRNESLKATDKDQILGISPLYAARKSIEILEAVYEARFVIYDKRGAIGFLSSGAKDDTGAVALTPDEKKAALQELHNLHGLKRSKSPIGVIQAPVTYTKIASDIKDLLPHEETKLDATEIANVLRVPRELYALEGATYENQKEAEKRFYTSVIIPMAERKAAELTNFLGLEAAGIKLIIDASGVDVLQADKKLKAEVDAKNISTYTNYFFTGQWTLNDIRAELGMEKVSNALYDRLVFDMSPDDITFVTKIIKKSYDNSQTTQGGGTSSL